jgi:hypothetical protein
MTGIASIVVSVVISSFPAAVITLITAYLRGSLLELANKPEQEEEDAEELALLMLVASAPSPSTKPVKQSGTLLRWLDTVSAPIFLFLSSLRSLSVSHRRSVSGP